MFGNWFPAADLTIQNKLVIDEAFFDCDEQMRYFGNRNGYLQLGSGPFQGRLFATDVGDVSIFVEYSNQPLEKEVLIAPDSFSFVTAISGIQPDIPFGGDKVHGLVAGCRPRIRTYSSCAFRVPAGSHPDKKGGSALSFGIPA